jgi:hypothetical protein
MKRIAIACAVIIGALIGTLIGIAFTAYVQRFLLCFYVGTF